MTKTENIVPLNLKEIEAVGAADGTEVAGFRPDWWPDWLPYPFPEPRPILVDPDV